MVAGKRTMVLDFIVDDKEARDALGRIDRSVGNTAESFGKAGKAIKTAMGVVATGAIIEFGRQMADHAAQMEAIERRTDTVFGSSSTTSTLMMSMPPGNAC